MWRYGYLHLDFATTNLADPIHNARVADRYTVDAQLAVSSKALTSYQCSPILDTVFNHHLVEWESIVMSHGQVAETVGRDVPPRPLAESTARATANGNC